jgi:hypothetical protein
VFVEAGSSATRISIKCDGALVTVEREHRVWFCNRAGSLAPNFNLFIGSRERFGGRRLPDARETRESEVYAGYRVGLCGCKQD